MVSQHLLLDYLADQSQQRDAALAESARSFLVCRMFVDELSSNHASGLSTAKLHQSDLLVQYKKIMQQADKGTSCDLEAGMHLIIHWAWHKCDMAARSCVLHRQHQIPQRVSESVM